MFICQGCLHQLPLGSDGNLGKKILAIEVVELFNHVISLKHNHWGEPEIAQKSKQSRIRDPIALGWVGLPEKVMSLST